MRYYKLLVEFSENKSARVPHVMVSCVAFLKPNSRGLRLQFDSSRISEISRGFSDRPGKSCGIV
jgi:hypothetical protein